MLARRLIVSRLLCEWLNHAPFLLCLDVGGGRSPESPRTVSPALPCSAAAPPPALPSPSDCCHTSPAAPAAPSSDRHTAGHTVATLSLRQHEETANHITLLQKHKLNMRFIGVGFQNISAKTRFILKVIIQPTGTSLQTCSPSSH